MLNNLLFLSGKAEDATMISKDELGTQSPWRPDSDLPSDGSWSGTLASPSLLDEVHFRLLRRALLKILSTDIAESTYAQIIDGLPTVQSFKESYDYMKGHPVYELNHTNVCPGSLDTAREFRSKLELSDLRFEKRVRDPQTKLLPPSSPLTRARCFMASNIPSRALAPLTCGLWSSSPSPAIK